MKIIIIISIVFLAFLSVDTADACYLIEGGSNETMYTGPAILNIETNNMRWVYNTNNQVTATGKITVKVEDQPGSSGHNCSVQAQLLLMRGNEILACYTVPEVDGVTGAYLSFEHTFIVGYNYGIVDNLSIKSRVYVCACFSNSIYGDSMISYVQENTCNYETPPPLEIPVSKPAKPTNLTVSGSSFLALLNWTGGEGATSFEVFRKTGLYGSWVMIGTTVNRSYLDDWVFVPANPSGLLPVETFYYKVRSVNTAGYSNYSSIVSIKGTLIE